MNEGKKGSDSIYPGLYVCVWLFFAVVDDLVSRTIHFLPDYLSIYLCLVVHVCRPCLLVTRQSKSVELF